MNLLALETSTECCSVALECNGEIVARSEYAPRRHAELLLPMCEEVLAEAGIVRRQLDAIAVGRGPGAFTGVRLAISAAQGIALALDVPVFPVSSLAALALDVPVDGHALLAVIDARMGEVYAGVFERDIDGLVSLIGTESVGAPDRLVLAAGSPWAVIGTGWGTYREAIVARLGAPPAWAESQRFPQAIAVARLARRNHAAGQGVAPEFALPVYLRDKVAYTTSERNQAVQSVGT
ncbi:MAG TPA: tRNA (adenosine(37)-N6)-threonylcarbamoyltransferase complex dimerization subunit type 1 TsaB [Dokdonella sp.]|uniref:tRNA (adenosine(37)-N6)-threonylcarbamoyltransferase complex dimerization subunit type 1 TsaB n=2 Tax=Dokdonella sp. TaxID=2291710 RepID=UPI002BE9F5BB|nr:tRNA (adenosine(37)-N6)-threonylcarbamoyltransferase complex dimerization subunit type 1 TsaB [Dokdonella sp.]HOX70276.1 tRNA (adenosine(37)-N6)-threonylcarbamoyltransferase complex dimerization subunit type 1 TsaB [Dokdonella sp.]HPG94048.1 tRNA (adenosine(37)-N6)-threonylcarbamoyltransferase complex dimerization subunit type 1 TsaB [Dokdonella sp.]HPN80420.1 tRNA (adenosine(37)-N6)-threonylcarbamoyltransferase complex dimerization subunit type 1 TsaB [Dokdonella sp.]